MFKLNNLAGVCGNCCSNSVNGEFGPMSSVPFLVRTNSAPSMYEFGAVEKR